VVLSKTERDDFVAAKVGQPTAVLLACTKSLQKINFEFTGLLMLEAHFEQRIGMFSKN
jgi:hypothetical protein